MAASESTTKLDSEFTCDFCGYRCHDEAVHDEHLQSHIVECFTTSTDCDFGKCDEVTGNVSGRDTLLEDSKIVCENGIADNKNSTGVVVAQTPTLQSSVQARDVNYTVSLLNPGRPVCDAFSCAVCGVGFSTSMLYQQHVKTHVQKIDAALNRQGIFPTIVPVTVSSIEPGKLPKVTLTNQPKTLEVKPHPIENCKPKLIVDNPPPTQKLYHDKLGDTVEALRLSLQKPPVASVSPDGNFVATPVQNLVETASEVDVGTTTSELATLLVSRKRKQELQQRHLNVEACNPTSEHSGSDDSNDRRDSASNMAVHEDDETSSDETVSSEDDESNNDGESRAYMLLQEHSYPVSPKSSPQKQQHPSGNVPQRIAPLSDSVGVNHAPATKTFECNICGMKFSVLRNLNRHLRTHRKKKRRKDKSRGDPYAAVPHSKGVEIASKDTPLKIAKNFGIDINSKMLDTVDNLNKFNRPKPRPAANSKVTPPPPSNSQHWVSKKLPQQQRRQTPSVLNIKCFCGRKFTSVLTFRKHMQCHVHGPSRSKVQNDDNAPDDLDDDEDTDVDVEDEVPEPVKNIRPSVCDTDRKPFMQSTQDTSSKKKKQLLYNTEGTVESVYNLLRNNLGNASLPSFVTEKAPTVPKTAPDRSQFRCPQCGAGFTSRRYMSKHIGSKRCAANVRQNWQASQKNTNLSKPTHCSDCGAAMPSYAPKVLFRHVTNVADDDVKCRFCLLKHERLRQATSTTNLTEKINLPVSETNENGIPPLRLSTNTSESLVHNNARIQESVKTDILPQEEPVTIPNTSVSASISFTTIDVNSSTVESLYKDIFPDSNLSKPTPVGLNASEAGSITKSTDSVPSSSSSSVPAMNNNLIADVSGVGTELKKDYQCDRCGLIYFTAWSYSRHRQKFCAPVVNVKSTNPTNNALAQVSPSGSIDAIASSAKLPESAQRNLSDSAEVMVGSTKLPESAQQSLTGSTAVMVGSTKLPESAQQSLTGSTAVMVGSTKSPESTQRGLSDSTEVMAGSTKLPESAQHGFSSQSAKIDFTKSLSTAASTELPEMVKFRDSSHLSSITSSMQQLDCAEFVKLDYTSAQQEKTDSAQCRNNTVSLKPPKVGKLDVTYDTLLEHYDGVEKSADLGKAKVENEEDMVSDISLGGFMRIDLGESSEDDVPSKADNSSGENDSSDEDSDPDVYLCNFCDTRSTSPLSYKEHLQTHVSMVLGTDDHKSFYCEKCATHTNNILHQCRSTTEVRSSTCGICLRQFQSMESAKMHALKCHDNITLVFCLGCYWGLGSVEELKEHVSECEGCVIHGNSRPASPAVLDSPKASECGTVAVDDSNEVQVVDLESIENRVISSAGERSPPPVLATKKPSFRDHRLQSDKLFLTNLEEIVSSPSPEPFEFFPVLPKGAQEKELSSPGGVTTTLPVGSLPKKIKKVNTSPSTDPSNVTQRITLSLASDLSPVARKTASTPPSDGSDVTHKFVSSPECSDVSQKIASSPDYSATTQKISSSSPNIGSDSTLKLDWSPPSDRYSNIKQKLASTTVNHPKALSSASDSQVLPQSLSGSSFPSEESKLEKPLSYADILGLRPLSPPPTQQSVMCEFKECRRLSLRIKSLPPDDVDSSSSCSLLPSTKPRRAKRKPELQVTPSKSSPASSVEIERNDDSLDFTCYSPEIVSSPTECSDIQSEIDDIISKLPGLRSGVSTDLEVCSSDGEPTLLSPKGSRSASRCSVTATIIDSPSKNISKQTAVAQNIDLSLSVSQKRKSPYSDTPDKNSSSPYDTSSTTSPLLRKRKNPKCIPDSPEVSSDVGIVSNTEIPSDSAESTPTPNEPLANNGIKLKIVRIATQKGKNLLKNSVRYKLVSEPVGEKVLKLLPTNVLDGATTVKKSQASTEKSPNVVSTAHSLANVQGAAIDSTIWNKPSTSADANSSMPKARVPLLQHLFSEVRPSVLDAYKTSACTSTERFSSDCVERKPLVTSSPAQLISTTDTKRRCTARKSLPSGDQRRSPRTTFTSKPEENSIHVPSTSAAKPRFTARKTLVSGQNQKGGAKKTFVKEEPLKHTARKSLRRPRPLTDENRNGTLFTDTSGVQHVLPECAVRLIKLDEPAAKLKRIDSSIEVCTSAEEIQSVTRAPQVEHCDNKDLKFQIHSNEVTDKIGPSVNESKVAPIKIPSLDIQKILSSMKRFIKPPATTDTPMEVSTTGLASPSAAEHGTTEAGGRKPVETGSDNTDSLCETATSVFAPSSVRPASCKTYSRDPFQRPPSTRRTAQEDKVRAESPTVDSSTKDGDINNILSVFRTLIERDTVNPPSTPL